MALNGGGTICSLVICQAFTELALSFADVELVTVSTIKKIHHAAQLRGGVLIFGGAKFPPDRFMGHSMGGDAARPKLAGQGLCHALYVGEGKVAFGFTL